MTIQAQQEARRNLGTVDTVSQMLGLPRSTIYDRAREGRLPGVVRIGQRVLFDIAKLNAWIDAGGDTASKGIR